MQESVLRIGVVTSVRGRNIEISVDKAKNVPHLLYNGDLIRNVSVGSYIKINKGFERIIGVIETEFITEDKSYDSKKDYILEKEKIKRILQVKLVGFLEDDGFCQGVKELPLIDNKCYILTKSEYDRVHSFTKEGEDKIKIGVLASESSKEIEIGVNSLFASHIGIFGNTGSGKSYSLASLYHSLFEKFGGYSGFKQNARFLLIDFNGEYIENWLGRNVICNENAKEIFDIPERKIVVEKKSLENIEILSIILDATDKTQKPFIKSCLEYSKFKKQNFCPKSFLQNEVIKSLLSKKDKEYGIKSFLNLFNDLFDSVKNRNVINEIKELIVEELGQYSNGSYYSISVEKDVGKNISKNQNYNGKFEAVNLQKYFIGPLEQKIQSLVFDDNLLIDFLLKMVLKYHLDIINGHSNVEHISPLIRRAKTVLLKLNELVEVQDVVDFKRNLKIVSLKNVNDNSLKKIIALIVCKENYDNQKRDGSIKTKYLNIILDEAHNILSTSSQRESETWKDYRLETFEEIIKEGRKFGTFLTIASQRPSDISSTIISQLHNYFLHRLINNKDIEAVEKTVSYLDKISFESLPILPTGTCILAGLSAKLPVVVKMNALDEKYQPNSQTIKLTDFWKNEDTVETPVPKTDESNDLPF